MSEGAKPVEFLPLAALEIEDPGITQEKALQGAEVLKKKNWSAAVNRNEKIASEQKETASALMKDFSQGVADVVHSVAKRRRLPANYRVPHVRIGDNAGLDATYIGSINRQEGKSATISTSEIVVDASRLDALAQDDPSMVYEFRSTNTDGSETITEIGTPSQIAYTTGAEEAAHSIFFYQDVANGSLRPNTNRGSSYNSLAEYDAQPMEYHGRGWQVRAILDAEKEGKISHEEAERLAKPFIDRIQAAAKYRREKKFAEKSA